MVGRATLYLDMSPEQIRESLNRHLGGEKYRDFLRDFVRVARRKGRLTYWLEQSLLSAGLHLTFEECLPIFTFCHVHGVPLCRRAVPIRRDVDDIRYSNAFERATACSFPYAKRFVLFTETHGSAETIEVDQCDECVREMEMYLAAEPPVVDGLILTIQDVLEIPNRGTLVTGIVDAGWSSAKVGDSIDLLFPNGEGIRTYIRDLERIRRTESRRQAGILLGESVSANQIPQKTKIVKVN
jgi:hypothetical protein